MDEELNKRVQAIRTRLEKAGSGTLGACAGNHRCQQNGCRSAGQSCKRCRNHAFGRDRVQEILEKLPHLDASFQIDLIGQLQNNKVKYIIDKVAMIQSLDRESLAQEIDRRAQQHGIKMPVLIQVNIGSEPQKGGIAS